MEILKCQGVRKIYGTGDNQVTALDGINLSVDKGEFVAIVGSSGSGKSTLLHILGTVDKPTEGSVIIDGTDLSTLTPTQAAIFRRRKVGLVYQFYNLIPTLTVRRNILMPLALDKKKPNQEYFQKIVDTLGIADRLEALPSQLSGGQQQRVAIARAIATKPPIIMADEPTGALDSRTGHEVLEFLQQLNREGTTVILITHDNGIAATARRCVRLTDGRIVEDKVQEVDWY